MSTESRLHSQAHNLELTAPVSGASQFIISDAALAFVQQLVERFGAEREALLEARQRRQEAFDAGVLPDFREDTRTIRQGDWQVAPIPHVLQDRRVEITGPAEPKMIVNALNSGAMMFMVDFEDALSPTWHVLMEGQASLYHAVRHQLHFTSEAGKEYALHDDIATLIVRPRGWHLSEKHVRYQGQPIPGALLDFGLFFFHNAAYQAERGSGPFFYLPKLETCEEAALWAKILAFAEETLGVAHGTTKATVLIETITAAFEMDEILYVLKDYAAGLNCGRWDYIFSFIKKFHKRPDFVLPDRAQVTMTTHFLQAYSELLIQTCHKRGAFAMGGMAPQIPIKGDDAAHQAAMEKVKADKLREVRLGHDGTWVAHPGLIPVARAVFDAYMPGPNQLHVTREDVTVTQRDLLTVPEGTITEPGVRNNIAVCLSYLTYWLQGQGCVPIFHMMEDAATAEIARTQLWQWCQHPAGVLEDGRDINAALLENWIDEEYARIHEALPEQPDAEAQPKAQAASMLKEQTFHPTYTEFLTLPAYEMLA